MTMGETMFAPLPQSVRDEGWQVWETQRMQREDVDASLPPPVRIGDDSSDSELSCLALEDSPITRRRKLDGLVYGMNLEQISNMNDIKRKAQRAAYNQRRQGKAATSHLDDLMGDISASVSYTHLTLPTNREV